MARLKRDDVVRYMTQAIADVELRREIELAIDNDPQVAAWYLDAMQDIEMLHDRNLPHEPVHDPAWDALTPDALAELRDMLPLPTPLDSLPATQDAGRFPFRRPVTDFVLDDSACRGGSKKKRVYRGWFAPLATDTTPTSRVLRVSHWLELWHDETATRLGIRIPIDDSASLKYANLNGAVLVVRVSGAPYTYAVVRLTKSHDPSILTLPRNGAPFTPSAAVKKDPMSLSGDGAVDKRVEEILGWSFCVLIQNVKRSG